MELDVDEDSDIIEDERYYKIEVDSVPTFLISKKGSFVRKFVGGGYLEEINNYLERCALNEKLNNKQD